jgi:hypothetical protein
VLVDACSKAGASGAVATALERVARDLGDLDALARGYIALAAAAKHPVLRGGLVQRAVRIWEEETGHPERAFDALVGEWKKTFSSEIEPDLARLANAVAEGNPVAGRGRLPGALHRDRAPRRRRVDGRREGPPVDEGRRASTPHEAPSTKP